MQDDPILLTLREAAVRAGTTLRTIQRWTADRRLTTYDVRGRLHVRLDDLNRVEAATRAHGGRARKWRSSPNDVVC